MSSTTPSSSGHAATISAFGDAAARILEQNIGQISRCVGLLSDAEAWSRENERCNSIANLLLHLNGNVSQWILAGVGDEPIERDRPAEFAARQIAPVAPALQHLQATVRRACEIIRALSAEQFGATRVIQGYTVPTINAVFHVAEHFSFHTGQIVHRTKAIKNVDLSLYDSQGRRLIHSQAPW